MDKINKNRNQLEKKNLSTLNKIEKKNNNKNELSDNYKELNMPIEFKKVLKFDEGYRKKLDKRMDILMEEIDKKINNNSNYNELSSIISTNKTNSNNLIKDYNNNSNNNSNNIIINNKKKEIKNDKYKIKTNSNNNSNINSYANSNIISNNKINKTEEILEDYSDHSDDKKNIMNKSQIFPTRIQIICKRDNEINNRLLKRTKYLENEVNYLKFRLNNVEKQKEFLQGVIRNNKNIKKSLFDLFLIDYFKKMAINWKDITNELIDELIIDEIHELTKTKLKLRKIKREEEQKESSGKNKISDINQISPIEMEEFKLFNENLYGIKKVIRSVKESERNLCKKYKVKINNLK